MTLIGGAGVLDFDYISWDDANVNHIAAADLDQDEVEDVLYDPDAVLGHSHRPGRRTADGWTRTGKYIRVVFEMDEDNGVVAVRPVTAFPLDDD